MPSRTSTFILKKAPPAAKIIFDDYKNEVRKEMQDIAQEHVNSRKEIVADFKDENRPKFYYRTVLTLIKMQIKILVEEADPTKPIWRWLDKTGTSAHVITPNNPRGRLYFKSGTYQSKTSANPARYGGAGKTVGGSLIGVSSVNHPGFPARKFSKAINDDMEKRMKRRLYNAGRRGLRRALKSG